MSETLRSLVELSDQLVKDRMEKSNDLIETFIAKYLHDTGLTIREVSLCISNDIEKMHWSQYRYYCLLFHVQQG